MDRTSLTQEEWFLNTDSEVLGPFSLERLNIMLSEGEILPLTTISKNKADGPWIAIGEHLKEAQTEPASPKVVFVPPPRPQKLELTLTEIIESEINRPREDAVDQLFNTLQVSQHKKVQPENGSTFASFKLAEQTFAKEERHIPKIFSASNIQWSTYLQKNKFAVGGVASIVLVALVWSFSGPGSSRDRAKSARAEREEKAQDSDRAPSSQKKEIHAVAAAAPQPNQITIKTKGQTNTYNTAPTSFPPANFNNSEKDRLEQESRERERAERERERAERDREAEAAAQQNLQNDAPPPPPPVPENNGDPNIPPVPLPQE